MVGGDERREDNAVYGFSGCSHIARSNSSCCGPAAAASNNRVMERERDDVVLDTGVPWATKPIDLVALLSKYCFETPYSRNAYRRTFVSVHVPSPILGNSAGNESSSPAVYPRCK